MFPVQDLIMLGLLMDGPQHGYEIKQIIEKWMKDIAKIAPGTIYYTLKKLEKRELVISNCEKKGNRPERRVYGVTEKGKVIFFKLLKQGLFVDERPFYIFDSCLYFAKYINEADMQKAIDTQLEQVKSVQENVRAIERDNPGQWHFEYEALRKKAHLLTNAFEQWYIYLRESIKQSGKTSGRQNRIGD